MTSVLSFGARLQVSGVTEDKVAGRYWKVGKQTGLPSESNLLLLLLGVTL